MKAFSNALKMSKDLFLSLYDETQYTQQDQANQKGSSSIVPDTEPGFVDDGVNKKVADNIRKTRLELGFTWEQFSLVIHDRANYMISADDLLLLEDNRKEITVSVLEAIAQGSGQNPNQLLGRVF